MSKLVIEECEPIPDVGSALDMPRESTSIVEIHRHFHLFTLGPVYVGARLDSNMLEVFAKQEEFKFKAVTVERPFRMFQNLNEWDFMIQGIERTKDEKGNENYAARNFAQFMQGWDFVNRDTRFYSKVYSRPAQVIPKGQVRGVPVEVFMLTSNKGTQEMHGANPYVITVDPARIAKHIRDEADAVFGVLEIR